MVAMQMFSLAIGFMDLVKESLQIGLWRLVVRYTAHMSVHSIWNNSLYVKAENVARMWICEGISKD